MPSHASLRTDDSKPSQSNLVRHDLATRAPFSFDQSLTFIARFPPNRDEYILTERSITAALTIGDRAVPITVRAKHGPAIDDLSIGERDDLSIGERDIARGLWIDAPIDVPATEVLLRVSAWLGADHDLGAFYAAARTDRYFAPLVRALYGLHHVAFMSLAEIAVYCVMMQRTPITMAARMKARFLDRFGLRVTIPATPDDSMSASTTSSRASTTTARASTTTSRELRSMPNLAFLATLDGDDIGAAIRHRVKGPAIAKVVRGVAALGERFLREAPYTTARDALLAIPGVGPFSATAILLRGLGRMDDVPIDIAEREARSIYGRAYDRAAIAKRYGAHIGYWSFYVKTGVARASQ
jgi:DNA-3-methyladenine glycosylase II